MVDLECIPLGAGHAEEGVCILLRIGPYRVLCDCGLADLRSLATPILFGVEQIPFSHLDWPADIVLCSHAHSDHARGLLGLHQTFPHLPIYATEVTAQLLPLNWPEEEDVPTFCQTLPWRSPVELLPGLTLEFYPAGHLPGAAACLLTYSPTVFHKAEQRSYSLLYTGDFLLSNSRLVDGLPLSDLRGVNPDVLIVEGSFGTVRHPHRRQQETQLAERMMRAVQQNMSVMLPVPILGLAQELLMLMRSHHYFTGKELDIWVEEPIAQGCDAYLNLLPYLPPPVQNFAQHQPLFWDERIRPRVGRLAPKQRLQIAERPCIALVPETANIQDYCSRTTRPWLVLLPEYRPRSYRSIDSPSNELVPTEVAASTNRPHTLQRWKSSVQEGKVALDTFLLSEHCDGPGTTQLIHNLRPQHVVFIHGSPDYLADLTSLEELANRYHLHSPSVGKRLELPIGEGLIQPTVAASTDAFYEGEVHELKTSIAITLPQRLLEDPRWRTFGDTGIIEASWQGDMLMLRSIPQRELLLIHSQTVAPEFQGCANCLHYRAQRCWNPLSSLQGFKVAPEGYCPAFERDGIEEDPDQRSREVG
jgi:Cft2 family RNA processing exonuclease